MHAQYLWIGKASWTMFEAFDCMLLPPLLMCCLVPPPHAAAILATKP